MGCAPLLIYYLLKGIRVNILKLIINFMLSANLLIPSTNLPFGMMITHFLKYFKIDISSETAFAPSVNIDHTFLKRMQAGVRECANVPLAPPQYDLGSSSSSIQALMDRMNSLELYSSFSAEKILAN